MPASDNPEALNLTLPPALIEAIAHRAAELVLQQFEQRRGQTSPYLTIVEAATYARCGRRTLILRSELETYLTGTGQAGKGRPNQARSAPPAGDSISAPSRATVTNPGNKPTR